MARRALPALLALIALVADLSGSHGVALAFLLAAIPAAFALALECYGDALEARCGGLAAFALALECYGDALEARCGGLRPLAAAGALALLVLSAALRSPAVVGGVPRLAVSALVLTLLLYAGALLGALLAPTPAARHMRAQEPEAERLAA